MTSGLDPSNYEQAACGLLTTDLDGTITAVNGTLLGWIAAERSDLVGGRRFADLLTTAGRIYHETHVAPMLAMQGSAREIAFELVGPDGGRLPVLVNALVDTSDQGRPMIQIAVFDATERRMYERELLAAKERAERSDAHARVLARTLQDTLLPHRIPEVPGLDIAAVYMPAGAGDEIGGDFYDVFQIAPDDWMITLGDVEGKGVQAALVTALVRYTIRAAAVEHEPAGVLRIVNEVLQRDHSSRFCSAVVLRCRRANGRWRVTISCGGHPIPVRAEADRVELAGRPGTLLGLFAQVTFHEVDIDLDRGAVLLAYTDGVSEARRADGGLFGEARISALMQTLSTRPASEILEQVVATVLDFGGQTNRDDIAAIALRSTTSP